MGMAGIIYLICEKSKFAKFNVGHRVKGIQKRILRLFGHKKEESAFPLNFPNFPNLIPNFNFGLPDMSSLPHFEIQIRFGFPHLLIPKINFGYALSGRKKSLGARLTDKVKEIICRIKDKLFEFNLTDPCDPCQIP